MKLQLTYNNKQYQVSYNYHLVTDGKREIKEYELKRGKVFLRGSNLDKLINELEKKLE